MVRHLGLLRPKDLKDPHIPRVLLTRLCRKGQLTRTGRGLYSLPKTDITEHHALAEIGRRTPGAVVCLLTALRYHGLTTQAPFEVWIAIDVKARKPSTDTPLRVVRFSGKALTHGVGEHVIERVPVRITSPAKTVADCFKYRNKIGLDVALEALRAYRRSRRSMDDLWHAAAACRMQSVMRPYLEAIE